MACRTSKQEADEILIDKGVINKDYKIISSLRFDSEHNKLKDRVKKRYGIQEDLYLKQNGYVFHNDDVFKQIDGTVDEGSNLPSKQQRLLDNYNKVNGTNYTANNFYPFDEDYVQGFSKIIDNLFIVQDRIETDLVQMAELKKDKLNEIKIGNKFLEQMSKNIDISELRILASTQGGGCYYRRSEKLVVLDLYDISELSQKVGWRMADMFYFVLLHEVGHHSFNTFSEEDSLKIEELYREFLNYHTDVRPYVDKFRENQDYVSWNLAEFLAESLSNPDFANYLDSIKTNNKTLLDKVIDFVINIFGIKEDSTIFRELYKIYLTNNTSRKDVVATELGFKDLDEAVSTINNMDEPIKLGVQELFDSNPELANQAYEALGFKKSNLELDFNIEETDKINIITVNNNQTVGNIELQKKDNNYFVRIVNSSYENQGIATELYKEAIKYATERNGVLKPDEASASQVLSIYKKLEKEGLFKIDSISEQWEDGRYVIEGKSTGVLPKKEITQQQKQQALQLYSQYLDTVQSQVILPSDKVVFGHPTIGKSFLKKQGEDKFISLDDDYATEINTKVKEIADKYNVITYQVKDGGTQKWNNEYNQMMQEMFNVAKQKAISENKTLFTSNTNLLRNNAESFDKIINLTDKEFERRIQDRGAKYDIKEWKSQINEAISKLPTNKVINTDKYLSDLFLGSKQDIEGFKKYVENNSGNKQIDSEIEELCKIKSSNKTFK